MKISRIRIRNFRVVRGRTDDDYGEVEFVAHYVHNQASLSMIEHSIFTKEDVDNGNIIGQVEPKTINCIFSQFTNGPKALRIEISNEEYVQD